MKAIGIPSHLLIRCLVVGSAAVVLALHAWHYMPFIADDALISLRYSKRLIQGYGLNWNPGERVEGYSNLLWVLANSVVGLTGIDLVHAARLLGFVGMSAAISAVIYSYPLRTFRGMSALVLVLMFLPLSAPIAVWTIGGMEQPMVAGLLAWAVVLCYRLLENNVRTKRNILLPSLLFGLLSLTRLDGVLFTGAAMVAIVIAGRGRRAYLRIGMGLAVFPILFLLLQICFRLVYYGEWIPNTALVKLNPSGKHLMDGWEYLWAGALPIFPLVLVAVFSIVISFWRNFRRERMLMLCVLVLAWSGYICLIGGDIFPAWRHFVPLIVLLVLMAAIGAEWVAERSQPGFALASAGCVLLLCGFFILQNRDSENLRAISERWEWDGKVIGTLLKDAFGPSQPLLAVDPAGCLPYWSELPAVDMLGLNDYHLPRHPPADIGQGPIGHELGDGKYVLDRQPDLVIFLLPTGNDRGYFLSGRQMQEDPRFFRDYTLVRFEGRDPYTVVSRIWARKYSQRIGIRDSQGQITVPAFLLNGNPATVARLGSAGGTIVSASAAQPARIEKLQLSAGRWHVEPKGSAPTIVRVFLSTDAQTANAGSDNAGRMLLNARAPATLELREPQTINVDVEVLSESTAEVEVSELTLKRLRD